MFWIIQEIQQSNRKCPVHDEIKLKLQGVIQLSNSTTMKLQRESPMYTSVFISEDIFKLYTGIRRKRSVTALHSLFLADYQQFHKVTLFVQICQKGLL